MFGWFKRRDTIQQHNEAPVNHLIKYIDDLPDEELDRLNTLLPWASYVNDARGRRFGKPYSSKKRFSPEKIPDPRIVELNRRYALYDLSVLEVGCFEGNHTVGLSLFCDRITAIDSRIEHVIKTIVRTAMYGYRPHVFRLDLEQPFPDGPEFTFDVLHHVGVLYHLSNPIQHLNEILPQCTILMLDTHVATEEDELHPFSYKGTKYRYKSYKEAGRLAPFAGMQDHAKWLLEKDLVKILENNGFSFIEVAERRNERNGLRILLYAHKESSTHLSTKSC